LLSKLNALPRLTPKNGNPDSLENNSFFMIKSDVTKIISNFAYHYPPFKDLFREAGGIPLVLNNCNLDDLNPFIKEVSLFCIRNLVTQNMKNQQLVEGLEAREVLQSDALDELNVRAKINPVTGKLELSKKEDSNM
jgi:ataxin-10